MPVYAAKKFVLNLFGKARTMRSQGQFRVYLQWRHEPNLGWWSSREKAWDTAKHFLEVYPNSPRVHPRDASRSTRGV